MLKTTFLPDKKNITGNNGLSLKKIENISNLKISLQILKKIPILWINY